MIPAGGEHVALKYGEAIHAALPWVLAEGDVDKAFKAFKSVWKDTQGDEKRNEGCAKLSLINYSVTHRKGNCLFNIKEAPKGDIQVAESVSPWEIPWAIDIGLDVPLVGRIDALCEHRDTHELMALEFKTSSEISARLAAGFELSPQTSGYTLALQVYTGRPISGVMMDFIGVKKGKAEDMVHPIRVQDHHLVAFLGWAKFWGGLILECEKKGDFPQWFTGCTPYSQFGMPGYMCEYKHLCDTPDWTTMKQFYEVRRDHPFDLGAVKAVQVPEGVTK